MQDRAVEIIRIASKNKLTGREFCDHLQCEFSADKLHVDSFRFLGSRRSPSER